MRSWIFGLGLVLLLGGCTDACRSSFEAYGASVSVKCYSCGVLIYDGRSRGSVELIRGKEIWKFQDAETGKVVRVSGDCVVEN